MIYLYSYLIILEKTELKLSSVMVYTKTTKTTEILLFYQQKLNTS